jgi:hypothetical protein
MWDMDELIRNLLKLQTLEFSGSHDDDTAAQVAELRSQIPDQVLGHYDRFLVRGKKALVAVSHQVCTGCHMRLPLAVIMTLKHGEDIQLCDSCGRYLYLLEEPEHRPAPLPSKAKPVRTARRRKKAGTALDSVPMEGSLPPPAQAQPRLNPE